MPGEELLLSFKESGNKIYIGELYNRHLAMIYGVCFEHLNDADSAQSAVMQIFEQLLYKISDYNINDFRHWIYSAAKNHCIQILLNEDFVLTVDENDFFDDIDVYGQNTAFQDVQLKKLQKQIQKRTRKKSHFLQWLIFFVCLIIIIVLSYFIFSYDSNKIEDIDDTILVESNSNELAIQNSKNVSTVRSDNGDNNVSPAENTNKVVEKAKQKDVLPVKKDNNKTQPVQEKTQKTETNQKLNQNQFFNDRDAYALSNEDTKSTASSNSNNNTASAIQKSTPVGGVAAFENYIKNNRKRILDSDCSNKSGKVILMFKVDDRGRPYKITVLRSLCEEADREAIRLLQNGPDWVTCDIFSRIEVIF